MSPVAGPARRGISWPGAPRRPGWGDPCAACSALPGEACTADCPAWAADEPPVIAATRAAVRELDTATTDDPDRELVELVAPELARLRELLDRYDTGQL